MTQNKEQEKLGDIIYETLKSNNIKDTRAYITDILSEAIIKAGYLSPEQLKAEGYFPYLGAEYQPTEKPCFHCETLTHWYDIDYQGYVCSQRCQNEMSDDVRTRSKRRV